MQISDDSIIELYVVVDYVAGVEASTSIVSTYSF